MDGKELPFTIAKQIVAHLQISYPERFLCEDPGVHSYFYKSLVNLLIHFMCPSSEQGVQSLQ